MQRICILGTTGSGKTWLARKLAEKYHLTLIDLDDLHWNPGWQPASENAFRRRIQMAKFRAGSAKGWAMAGNYSKVADLTREAADTIIWLDYSPWAVLPSLIRRQVHNIRTRASHCNGNYETWRQTFSRDSLFIWFFKTAFQSSQKFLPLYTEQLTKNKTIVRLRSRAETARFLQSL